MRLAVLNALILCGVYVSLWVILLFFLVKLEKWKPKLWIWLEFLVSVYLMSLLVAVFEQKKRKKNGNEIEIEGKGEIEKKRRH